MAENVYRQLQIRRDVEANIPALAPGEFFLTTDTLKLYIGTDGTLGGNKLVATL